VDENLVCESVQWLIQNQRGDGALPEVHHVIHREMVGGIYGNEGDVAMTAFVLSTLAECKCNGVNSQAAIMLATQYLENQYRTLNRPYSMALTAYALSLVNSVEKFKANDRLVQNAVYDNAKQTRYWNAGGNALNVETAGYALLAQLQLGRTGYAGPIVTYMTSQRKGGAGFVSTQDTVVALQALAAYSDKTKGRGLDLRVKITSELDINWKPAEIHITKENALLRRAIDVTRFLGGKLIVTAKGKGIGLLEVDVRYNLPSAKGEVCKFEITKPEIKEIKEKNPRKLFDPVGAQAADDGDDADDKPKKKKNKKSDKKRNKKKCRGKNKNKKRCKNKKPKPTRKPPTRKPPKHQPVKSIHLKFCTRYMERGNTSMSIIDIGILTGFKPEQKSLKKLKDDLPELDNYEVSDRSLVLYLSEIPNDRHLCVNVQFDREYPVGVVQVVPIIVYDYYEPDESCSVFYGPDKHSPLKLGVCDIGARSCKCTQDECAQHDPPIGNIAKLINMACLNYNYVIKGKVVLIDEQNAMLAYVVQVVKIVKQGNKMLKAGGLIELWKRGACQSPDLKENKEYLFMGRDEGERYELDKTSFVKLWPQNKGSKDKTTLDDFAAQLAC